MPSLSYHNHQNKIIKIELELDRVLGSRIHGLMYDLKSLLCVLKKLKQVDTIKGETDHQPRLDAWDKCSGLVHWEDPEGWDGEGGGRGDRDGEHM